jgi:hypothetical protein
MSFDIQTTNDHFGLKPVKANKMIEIIKTEAEKLYDRENQRLLAKTKGIIKPNENMPGIKIGYTFGELQKLNLPKREEIVRGLAKGENGSFNAVTNAGKTTLTRNLALSLVVGRLFPPLSVSNKKYRVVIIDSEDSLAFLRSDLNKMIRDFPDDEKELVRENLLLICEFSFKDEDLELNKHEHFSLIAGRILEFEADIVFIDTISKSFSIRNENDNSEIKEVVMKPLHNLARLTNTAIWANHHIGKAKMEEGQGREIAHKGRGASAFADLSRIIFNLDKTPEDNHVILSCAKIKGESFGAAVLRYDKEKRWFVEIPKKENKTGYQKLLDIFPDENTQIKRQEIEKIFAGEIPKSTLTKHLSSAVEQGDLIKIRGGYYSRDAQMLTPYSDEHLSISDNSNNNSILQDGDAIPENGTEHDFDEEEVEYF